MLSGVLSVTLTVSGRGKFMKMRKIGVGLFGLAENSIDRNPDVSQLGGFNWVCAIELEKNRHILIYPLVDSWCHLAAGEHVIVE